MTVTSQKKSPIRLLIALLVIGFGLYLLIGGVISLTDNTTRLIAPDGVITVEVLETDEDRTKGLSGRDSLADSAGMLFIFDSAQLANCFWMKDMLFAIDMIWLDDDKKVITVTESVSPDSYPESFCPESEAKYGLEVGSGRAAELGIVVGESLRF